MDLNISVFNREIKKFIESSDLDFNKFKNKSFFITGATGLIGMTVIKSLLNINSTYNINMKIIGMVRNLDKANTMYSEFNGREDLEFYVSDINKKISFDGEVNYIIHGASITSSKMFVENPVDTIDTAIFGTKNILEFAKNNNVEKVIYLSSMEIYGLPQDDQLITENNYQYINHMNIRSSYPESKKMVENMCLAYTKQYGLETNVIRLTQTFGPGVDINDGRIFAEFARCVMENRNIVLMTKGETKRCYLYTLDAVGAILTVIQKGEPGEVYNAANMDTYCSILEMANKVTELSNDGKMKVEIKEEDVTKMGFAPTLKMNLDTTKIKNLGWSAKTDLLGMFKYMIESMKESEKNA